MQIHVGPFRYTLSLRRGYLRHNGQDALGLCHTDKRLIEISDATAPSVRITTFWHELGHAIKRELDITDALEIAEESLANLLGIAMAQLDARTLARVHIYLTTGMECDDVIMYPGGHAPIPVFNSLSRAVDLAAPSACGALRK